MYYIKLAIRLVLTVIFFIPGTIMLWIVYSIMGIAFFLGLFYGIAFTVFGWLSNNDKMLQEGGEAIGMVLEILAIPFIFWWAFIKGDNPFEIIG